MIRILLIVILLTGCTIPLRSVTGEEVAAPWGFEYLCKQTPTPIECRSGK